MTGMRFVQIVSQTMNTIILVQTCSKNLGRTINESVQAHVTQEGGNLKYPRIRFTGKWCKIKENFKCSGVPQDIREA